MQNNVTYLSRKLQRSLDNNYNVIDMPAVIEIISTLEKTSVTKELLETTRLGKYINELRRKTSNESLAKRAKELLKRWRDSILPDANGQIRSGSANSNSNIVITETTRAESPCTPKNNSKKRPASSTPPDAGGAATRTAKKLLINGQNREFDFSDNSNCSVKELKKTDVIFINSDSNSSMPESINPGDQFEMSNDATDTTDASVGGGGASSMQPKKRGRKKGSKNHKNLVIAAEESFTNKMAVSRNSKVKTTQELLADIQNRKPSTQDIELRTAQLTESLSRIEHKLNPQKTINKNVTSIRNDSKLIKPRLPTIQTTTTTTENWSNRSSPEQIASISDDEIVDVVGPDLPPIIMKQEPIYEPISEPLTIENLLKQLPPIDKTILTEPDEIPPCECPTPKVAELPQPINEQQQEQERITVQIVGSSSSTTKESLFAPPSPSPPPAAPPPPPPPPPPTPTFISENTPSSDIDDERTSGDDVLMHSDKSDTFEENLLCPAKLFLAEKYHLDVVDDLAKVSELHEIFLPNVNGNFGAVAHDGVPLTTPDNIVPNFMSERLNKTPNENFQKYSISINNDDVDVDDVDGVDDVDVDVDVFVPPSDIKPKPDSICDSDDVRTAVEGVAAPNNVRAGGDTDFREWHETLDVISYNEELLRILPYVIID